MIFQSRKFYIALFVLGALYVLLVQQFFKNERKFLIQSTKYSSETAYSFNKEFQELNLPINKEISLHGIWFKHKNPKAIVLLFPESEFDLRRLEIEVSSYYTLGFDVLITSYRGTAKSTGKLTNEEDLFYDAQHWYRFAKSQFAEKEILIVGQGFGASVAAQLAGNNQPRALILENPYFSYGEYQSKTRFWWLPYTYFTSFPLKTWEYIRKTSCEIILLQDETKKDQKNCLINYLKHSDKSYWLEKNKDVCPSQLSENTPLFDKILSPHIPINKLNKE